MQSPPFQKVVSAVAQDSGSDVKQNQEVDLDELEVVILIIGKNANVLNQAATFLTRRGWPTSVITNVSKAVEHIAEKKPDFVLVSFNHTNPAVMKLPDLITTTFNLTSVGFVEQLDSSSQQRLNNFKMRYKIQGSPSGPNLQRSIRKILAEKFNVKGEATSAETKEREASGGNVTVKGSGPAAAVEGTVIQSAAKGLGPDGNVRIKTDEGAINAASGTRARPGEGADGAAGDSSEVVSNGKYTLTGQKPRKSLKDLTQAAVAGASPEASAEGATNGRTGAGKSAGDLLGKLKKDLFGDSGEDPNADVDNEASALTEGEVVGPDASGAPGAIVTSSKTGGPADAIVTPAGAKGGSLAERAEAARRKAQEEALEAQADALTARTNAYYQNSKHKPEAADLSSDDMRAIEAAIKEHAATEGGPRARYLTPAELAALTPAQLFERATFLALSRVAQPANAVISKVGTLGKVAVFPVDSTATPGYLVLGMQPDPHRIEDFFLRSVEGSLRDQMTELNVQGSVENGFWVHVPDVDFKPWVDGEAGFNIVLPHDESEVALAFFPFAAPLIKTEAHGENKAMLKVSLDDISTESPVNFKAYIHLQKNQKYFLYLRNGRQLQPEQKERLKDRKVKDVFMASEDVDNLRAFKAGLFLRDSIKKAG